MDYNHTIIIIYKMWGLFGERFMYFVAFIGFRFWFNYGFFFFFI